MSEVKSLYDIGFEHGYAKAKEEAELIKHGRWVDDNCSVCGAYVYHGDIRNYCPNCGVRMDGGEE